MTEVDEIHNIIENMLEKREQKFISGKTTIKTGMAVYDHHEINAIIDSLLDGWFGLGIKGEEFENNFSRYIGNEHSVLVNSGSSANLLALDGIKKKLGLRGGEIITPACTFPTTFNPILQLGFKPSVIDIDKTLNITPDGISSAITKETKGIFFPHMFGNPAVVDEITKIAKEKELFVIEDCCDALGSKFAGKKCGTWGDASTFSFYPAHGITMGEGGVVSTSDNEIKRIVRSMRDWGRDCWCRTDEKNANGACKSRFDHKIDGIPYDHKYVYSQIGYNMKPLELQAAMGIEQMKKLDKFNNIRKKNFRIYSEEMVTFSEHLEIPEVNRRSDPVFFGLPLTINDGKTDRRDLLKFLNENKIATRLMFGGNILRQPAYKNIECARSQSLENSDNVMRNGFWVGIHPGVTEEMIKYVVSRFKEYFSK